MNHIIDEIWPIEETLFTEICEFILSNSHHIYHSLYCSVVGILIRIKYKEVSD